MSDICVWKFLKQRLDIKTIWTKEPDKNSYQKTRNSNKIYPVQLFQTPRKIFQGPILLYLRQ